MFKVSTWKFGERPEGSVLPLAQEVPKSNFSPVEEVPD